MAEMILYSAGIYLMETSYLSLGPVSIKSFSSGLVFPIFVVPTKRYLSWIDKWI